MSVSDTFGLANVPETTRATVAVPPCEKTPEPETEFDSVSCVNVREKLEGVVEAPAAVPTHVPVTFGFGGAFGAVLSEPQAATKAKSTATAAVRKAMAGMTVADPAGYTAKMDASNQYLWRGDMIGSINAKQGFDILWKSKDIVAPVPFSPYVKS